MKRKHDRIRLQSKRCGAIVAMMVVLFVAALTTATTGGGVHAFSSVASAAPLTATKQCSSSNSVLHLTDPSSLNPPDTTTTAGGVATSQGNNNSYHLIWSPGAWKKFIYTSAALLVIPRLLGLVIPSNAWWNVLGQTSSSCHPSPLVSLWNNVGLPLVASSCCLLQLSLNVLAVGCAGWNKVLGPVRPYFLAWLLVASIQPPLSRPWVLVRRACTALLPEALDYYNNNNHGMIFLQQGPTAAAAVMPQLDDEIITLDLPTMGCVACIHSVNGALRQVPGVVAAKSQLNPSGAGGTATIQIPKNTVLAQELIQAVNKAGFPGATIVLSPDPETDTDVPTKNEETGVNVDRATTTATANNKIMEQVVTLDIPSMG